ncbi:RRM domain-containing protein [Haematococcus lacustris]|uniref:Branchpoint-bridging protein n=1 Tax=Haematococcus lacustris TaxID=44745 RepID=A0A699Z6B3_HAELA|nr:RRM domain-containing protein [Haematococcus lacustris]
MGDLGPSDPRVRSLTAELKDLDRRIEYNQLDIPPEGQRSPSPEPIYDRMGVRLNTRELRAKEKLLDRRLTVIEELMKEDPNFKPPADYRPRKYFTKFYIPQDEYPSHHFVGLLIGPRGNTQKRMQMETNTKISIRGKGSVKEGASKDPKFDHGEDEELHVLITGNCQADVDKARAMVELLCNPTDETMAEHKKLQLRELAALNGTLKDEVAAAAACWTLLITFLQLGLSAHFPGPEFAGGWSIAMLI